MTTLDPATLRFLAARHTAEADDLAQCTRCRTDHGPQIGLLRYWADKYRVLADKAEQAEMAASGGAA